MKFYHGSDNGNLIKLTVEKSNDGYIYLTPMYPFAVLYAGNSTRFWTFDKEKQKLVIREVCKDSLKKMYKGRKCYIYSTDEISDYEESEYLGRKTFRTKKDVVLKEKEVINDAYDKIMEMYEKGEIILQFWDKLTEEQKQKERDGVVKKFSPHMKEFYLKYRKDYDELTNLFPEMSLSKDEIKEIEM